MATQETAVIDTTYTVATQQIEQLEEVLKQKTRGTCKNEWNITTSLWRKVYKQLLKQKEEKSC